MKRWTALLLTLALCGSLAACGDAGKDTPATPGDPQDHNSSSDTAKPETDKTPEKMPEGETEDKPTDIPQGETADKPVSMPDGTEQNTPPLTSTPPASKPSSGSGSTVKPSAPAPTPTPEPTPQPTPEPAPSKPTSAQAQGYIGSSASALEGALGAPASKSYAPSCMGEGEDGIWSYDGFTVYTYREGGSETVQDVQ